MAIVRLDHLVLTVADIGQTCQFYETVLGMARETFGVGRVALKFGSQKINLHEVGKEFEPKAGKPTAGSADLCFIVDDLQAASRRIEDAGIEIIEGPVRRTGANGPLSSIYLRDPDENLLELAAQL